MTLAFKATHSLKGLAAAWALALAPILTIGPSTAQSAELPGWSATCEAPNWQTGEWEEVPDVNVHAPGAGYWGFTSRQAGGHWLIQFNTARIFGPASSRSALMFLFYHECAHAQNNSSSETVADCEGLALMREDMDVTPSMISQIRMAYASVGRPFPSGSCN